MPCTGLPPACPVLARRRPCPSDLLPRRPPCSACHPRAPQRRLWVCVQGAAQRRHPRGGQGAGHGATRGRGALAAATPRCRTCWWLTPAHSLFSAPLHAVDRGRAAAHDRPGKLGCQGPAAVRRGRLRAGSACCLGARAAPVPSEPRSSPSRAPPPLLPLCRTFFREISILRSCRDTNILQFQARGARLGLECSSILLFNRREHARLWQLRGRVSGSGAGARGWPPSSHVARARAAPCAGRVPEGRPRAAGHRVHGEKQGQACCSRC